jgi:cell division protein FtsB
MKSEHAWALDEIARDLDLVVFRLELKLDDEAKLQAERAEIRRQLERLRDQLQAVAEQL